MRAAGRVEGLQALLPVTLLREGSPNLAVEFVVDTGFTGYLTLPPRAVAALGLPFEYEQPVNLADNSGAMVSAHTARILWNGEEREISVLATGARPLLGTALLAGGELLIQFREDGLVALDDI